MLDKRVVGDKKKFAAALLRLSASFSFVDLLISRFE